TGFLITHCGLLVLVFGALLTVLAGSDGQMVMIDTANPQIQDWATLPNHSSRILLANQQRLEVFHLPRQFHHNESLFQNWMQAVNGGSEISSETEAELQGHHWRFSFNPGSFTWYGEPQGQLDTAWPLWMLQRLAAPLPGFGRDLSGLASLTVSNFYPNTAY